MGGASVAQVPGSWILSAENIFFKDGVLKAELRSKDGSMKCCTLSVEPGVSYSNNDGCFEACNSTCYAVPRVDDAHSVDDLKTHYTASAPAALKQVTVSCRWRDQGVGNQKG